MQPQDQVQSGQKSGFGHHMLEAERIIQLKQDFEQKILVSNLEDYASRDEILSLARILASEIRSLASDDERANMIQIITSAETASHNIVSNQLVANISGLSDSEIALMINGSTGAFKKRCHQFLDYFVRVQDRSNLQFNKLKELGEMQRYLDFNEVDTGFQNPYGYLISPQMEFFCRGLALRSKKGQNNIIIVGAKMGKGKSTFTMGGATTLSAMLGVPFKITPNVILNESRQYCEKLLSNLPIGSSIIFDQAGNQMGAASRWEDDQINLLNKMDLNRFSGMTLWVNWHAAKALDKDVRERISTHEVAIDKIGGPATIKGFNLNPHSNGPVVDQKTRKRIAITPNQAQEISEKDVLKLLDVPFYRMDSPYNGPQALKLTGEYNDKKERAKRFSNRIVGGGGRSVEGYYDDFLASLPDNVVRIDNLALEAYGQSKATLLSMRELAKKIGRATNQKVGAIFHNTDMLNLNEGYIDVNPYIRTYIELLQAQKRGAEQAAKEQGVGKT